MIFLLFRSYLDGIVKKLKKYKIYRKVLLNMNIKNNIKFVWNVLYNIYIETLKNELEYIDMLDYAIKTI